MNMTPEPTAGGGPEIGGLLESLLAITHSMLIAADAQKWDVVAELQGQRSGVISELFGAPPSHHDARNIAECLHQVLVLDRRIIESGKTGLHEIAEKIAGIDRGRRAREAYQNSSF